MAVLPIWRSPLTTNTFDTGYRFDADIVGLSNGNFLVVWSDENDDVAPGGSYDIVGQIYGQFGYKIGGPLYLNENAFNDGNEYSPAVAATDDGGFVLAHEHLGSLIFSRFDSDGASMGQESAPHGTSSGDYRVGDIVYRDDGTSLITYGYRGGGSDWQVWASAIDETGIVYSSVMLREDTPRISPSSIQSVLLADGRVASTFLEEDGSFGPEIEVTATDNAEDFWQNVTSAFGQSYTSVAALADGGYVVAYREGFASSSRIYAKIYNSDNSVRVDNFFLVDETDEKTHVQITGLKYGGFALAYSNEATQTVNIATFDNNGAAVMTTQSIAVQRTISWQLTSLEQTVDGRILVAWQEYDLTAADIRTAILDPRDSTIDVTDGSATLGSWTGSTIIGSAADDVFFGLTAADTLLGDGGNDRMFGGGDHDILRGGDGNDFLRGDNGNDQLFGGGENDTVIGSAGFDRMYGDSGDDSLNGGDGVDFMFGGSGRDVMEGGSFNDWLVAGDGDDRLFGGNGNDALNGGNNNDFLYGGAGGDGLVGGEGNDTLDGGIGADRMFGGNGLDKLFGGDGFDRLVGGNGADELRGGNGNDILIGGDNTWSNGRQVGVDLLVGDGGFDKIYGGGGIDWITGGNGTDWVEGGPGADRLLGDKNSSDRGGFADVFIFKAAWHSQTGEARRDVILDFEARGRDKIDLRAIDADTTRAGNQAFEFIGLSAFDDAGDMRARVFEGDVYLLMDRNGDGRADMEIKLESPDGIIDASDFFL